MRKTTSRIVMIIAAGVAALGLAVAGSPLAAAAPGTDGVPVPPAFAAQARSAGLSTAQSQQLQHVIDTDLREVGGTQTAANAIDLNHTGVLVEPVPGEPTARTFAAGPGAAATPLSASQCGSGDFCGWQLNNYSGAFLAKYICNSPVNIPSSWLRTSGGSYQGSFYNHNTGGAPGYLYSGTNGTGTLQAKPAAGARENWAWGLSPVTRSFVACK